MRIEKGVRQIADAFYAVAVRELAPAAIGELARELSALLMRAPSLRKALYSDRLDPAAKKDLVERAVGAKLSPYAAGLLLYVIDQGVERKLFKILAYLERRVEQEEARSTVEVVSAFPLEERELEAILEAVARAGDQGIRVRQQVDENLIAGVVVKVGDRVYDGSVRGRLERFRKAVSERL